MTPIYFPFTYISEPILDGLRDHFGKIVVYQSSKYNIPENMTAWEKSGKIDIRTPVEGDEERISTIWQDFKTWANLHQGSELSLLKTQTGKIPFFDADATSQIKSDITRRDPKEPLREQPDRTLNARLFLQMAQEHDMQNDALRQDLLSFQAMEQHLLKDLTGETLSSSSDIETYQSVATKDTGHYMTKERIDAWTRVMLHDQQPSGLYITHSRAVIEHLLDAAPEAKLLSNLDAATTFENEIEKNETRQNRLLRHLETIAADGASAATSAAIKTPAVPALLKEKDTKKALVFYIIPECSPHHFFSRYLEPTARQSKNKTVIKPIKNTLIGWYDR